MYSNTSLIRTGRAVGICPNYEESELTVSELTKYYCNLILKTQALVCTGAEPVVGCADSRESEQHHDGWLQEGRPPV